MPATPNRAEVKAAAVAALAGHDNLAGVPVDSGWPGKHLEREHVWIAQVTGAITYPYSMAGRKTRRDTYVMTVIFMAGRAGQTVAEAEARAQEMWAALDDLSADGEAVGSIDGVLWSLHGDTVEGPESEQTDEGAVAFIRADVNITADYT